MPVLWFGGEELKTKIAIPVEDKNGLDSRIAEHFGRAPFYAIVNLDSTKNVERIEIEENTGEHFGGQGHMHDHLLKLKPNAIVTHGMGPRGLIGFQSAGIAVLKAEGSAVRDIVAAYKDGKLKELTEGCHEAHHH
jgi:predicted Fe-Mo cluster-binding NifX family protein